MLGSIWEIEGVALDHTQVVSRHTLQHLGSLGTVICNYVHAKAWGQVGKI